MEGSIAEELAEAVRHCVTKKTWASYRTAERMLAKYLMDNGRKAAAMTPPPGLFTRGAFGNPNSPFTPFLLQLPGRSGISMSESLIPSFLGKKRAICSENR